MILREGENTGEGPHRRPIAGWGANASVERPGGQPSKTRSWCPREEKRSVRTLVSPAQSPH